MQIVEFREDHVGRGGVNNGYDDDQETRSWFIRTDDRRFSKKDIEAEKMGNGLPQPFVDRYPGFDHLLCKSLEIRQQDDKGGMIWRATARYDSRPLTTEEKDKKDVPDPLQRAAVYSGGFERSQKTINEDLEENPIVNKAGDVYLEPISKPRTNLRIKGRMNVPPNAIPDWFFDLKDKINEDEYERGGKTYAEKTLLFIPGDISEPMEQNGVQYIVIHWELEYREETWKEKRLNNGYNQLVYNTATGQNDLHVPIEIDGARPAEPQLLDLSGGMLTPQQVKDGVHYFLEWDTIETADFDVLP